MRKLQIQDAEVMRIAIQQEIGRSEESRYDHRLHGLLLVTAGQSCREVAALFGENGTTVQRWVSRFEHSKSWVSGRLALLQVLPASIQDQVRNGALSAHAAMKYLVPLARVDAAAAQALATSLIPLKPTTRQVEALYSGWQTGTERTRELIVHSPQVYLQAQATQVPTPPSATQRFLQDLGALGGIARRAHRALEAQLLPQLHEAERLEVTDAFARAKADLQRLIHRFELENPAC